jgi:hypothetical protein
VLAFFDRLRIEDESLRDWFRAVLASKTKDALQETLRSNKVNVGHPWAVNRAQKRRHKP